MQVGLCLAQPAHGSRFELPLGDGEQCRAKCLCEESDGVERKDKDGIPEWIDRLEYVEAAPRCLDEQIQQARQKAVEEKYLEDERCAAHKGDIKACDRPAHTMSAHAQDGKAEGNGRRENERERCECEGHARSLPDEQEGFLHKVKIQFQRRPLLSAHSALFWTQTERAAPCLCRDDALPTRSPAR